MIYKFLMSKLRPALSGYGLRRSRFLVWLVNAVKPKKVYLDGHILHLNKYDTSILDEMIMGNYEPEETSLLKGLIHAGDIIVDIGANIGYYTLLFARAAGEKGLVYAFEPDPTNFKLLQKNIKINGYNNIKAFPWAVSDCARKGFLYLNDYNAGDHRIYGSRAERKTTPIDIISLDDKFPDLKPNLIKIDTQGAEVGVLRGMEKILKRTPLLSVEYWPYGLEKAGTKGQDLLNILIGRGFNFKIDENLYTKSNQKFTNLLAYKNI